MTIRKIIKALPKKLFILVLYILLYILISSFHEPWFDEAQSWLIGRDASYYDMLFVLPHDEGHPALWWMILSIPAKMGIPFELGLKTIGLIISTIYAGIIIFKSPFPSLIKYSLPFTFFLFYQYGIIVRPYGLMLLIFMLLALNFKNRKSHPYRFTLLLCLLCMTSAYGLLMAGGIALCLCIDILKEKGFWKAFQEIWTDRQTKALLILLAVAILIVLQITPTKYTNNADAATRATNPLWVRIICMLFTILPDCVMTQSSWFFKDRSLLQWADITWYSLLSCVLIGLIIWTILFAVSSENNFKYMVLPYIVFAIFGASVYFSAHHIGVGLELTLFWLWIALEDPNRFRGWKRILQILNVSRKDRLLLKKSGILFVGVCLIIPLIWSISSSIQDVRLQYSYGRETANFLKKTGLDKVNIFCGWSDNRGSLEDVIDQTDSKYVSTSYTGTPILINAYFDHNIVENCNDGHEAYLHQRYSTDEINAENFSKWENWNPPDVLLDPIDHIENLFGGKVSMEDYSPVYIMRINYIWKGSVSRAGGPIYVRNDLLKKYHLEAVKNDLEVFPEKFEMTSEQIEKLKNGMLSLEDVMPFLKDED